MLRFNPDPAEEWIFALWEAAPTPAKAARLRQAEVEKLLKRHRIRRIDAAWVLAILKKQALVVASGVTEAAVAHKVIRFGSDKRFSSPFSSRALRNTSAFKLPFRSCHDGPVGNKVLHKALKTEDSVVCKISVAGVAETTQNNAPVSGCSPNFSARRPVDANPAIEAPAGLDEAHFEHDLLRRCHGHAIGDIFGRELLSERQHLLHDNCTRGRRR